MLRFPSRFIRTFCVVSLRRLSCFVESLFDVSIGRLHVRTYTIEQLMSFNDVVTGNIGFQLTLSLNVIENEI